MRSAESISNELSMIKWEIAHGAYAGCRAATIIAAWDLVQELEDELQNASHGKET